MAFSSSVWKSKGGNRMETHRDGRKRGEWGNTGKENPVRLYIRRQIDIYGLTTIDDLGISWWCAHADRMEEDVDQFDDVECSEEPVAAPGGAELPFEQSIGRNMMVLRSLE